MNKSYSNDDGSSSDDSSDEEYLTGSAAQSSVAEHDREALIRKKLLESFYGKTTSKSENEGSPVRKNKKEKFENEAQPIEQAEQVKEQHQDDDHPETNEPNAVSDVPHVGSINLDSTHFVAEQYTRNAIESSNAESLLSETERLATEIRGLDSTMQTLVYENYSKFIDATDAIRSIGRSVGASDSGLRRLATSIQNIERGTLSVDTALKESREAVAEKLRIKRHLVRLDALLKLPQTMRMQIASRSYGSAAKNYASAMPILSKHSGGFESLAKIESECNEIMKDMTKDLFNKLEAWGKLEPWNECLESEESSQVQPPKNIADIFECAGTLLFLSSPAINLNFSTEDENEEAKDPLIGSGTIDTHAKLALNACTIFLQKMLDIQQNKLSEGHQTPGANKKHVETSLGGSAVPKEFLNDMLEAATLFGVTFLDTNSDAPENDGLLSNFVQISFANFLSFTRDALQAKCEACIQHEDVSVETIDVSFSENDARLPTFEKKICLNDFDQVSLDLSKLVKSVRELASGLALPEVGLEVEMAGMLVDQTIEMCDGLIQKHISSHFTELRSRLMSKCVVPFVKKIYFKCEIDDDALLHKNIVSLASDVIGDVIEMSDAAISDIAIALASAPVEMTMVQQLIQKKTFDLSRWFAGILEVVGGCEDVGGLDVILDVSINDTDASSDDAQILPNEFSIVNENEYVSESEMNLLFTLLQRLNDEKKGRTENSPFIPLDHSKVDPHLALTVAEACRNAAGRLPADLTQSIVSVSSGSIPDDDWFSALIEKRFLSAANRSLFTFVVNTGDFATSNIIQDFQSDWLLGDISVFAPRPYATELLKLVKHACLHCASIFGFHTVFFPISGISSNNMQLHSYSMSGYGANVTGLQLDVERMFAEKLAIHGPVSFDQDSIASRIMRIAVKGMIEIARSSYFSRSGYHQLQLDAELIRSVAPHFLGEDEGGKIGHMLDEVLRNAEMRCIALEPMDDTEVVRCLVSWWDENIEERSNFLVNE